MKSFIKGLKEGKEKIKIQLLKPAQTEYEQDMNFYEKINELVEAINILQSKIKNDNKHN